MTSDYFLTGPNSIHKPPAYRLEFKRFYPYREGMFDGCKLDRCGDSWIEIK